MLGQEAPPQNSLRAARSVRTTAVSQSTKCVCPAAHAHAPSPALLGTHRRDPGERTSTRAIAALGPVSRAQAPSAAKARPRAAMARVAVWLTIPSGCACGRAVAGWHGRRSAHASCSDSPWLSERRAQRKASSTAHPATAPTQVCPHAPRGGRRLGVAFSLVTFFWRSKRKLLARRATPGLRPQHQHALQASKQQLRQAQPERIENGPQASTSSARTDRGQPGQRRRRSGKTRSPPQINLNHPLIRLHLIERSLRQH
ncbi:hypothetical protein SAMN05421875_10270 [Acidovorax soli]|uniref:Uncharacterized protein n=1 Tax=Acidovorax soli TaxID=592050 RepID=A0A1H3W4K9_9BURK|nr:hypothetical protein SAMN05421875_10270 [Acidovorax soli]